MKVMTIVGARPQFVKAAVVSRAFNEHREDITEIIVHTGQHYDENMSEIFFDELEIPKPHINLGVGGGSHGQNTGRMLEKLEAVMLEVKPDWILAYGDTDSTLAAALAAVKIRIPVAHVEAGLRSFNRQMPEEINRILTDHISSLLFAPTKAGRNNLINEGVEENKIHLSGDVMYDAAMFYRERARRPVLDNGLVLTPNDFVLCTIHRAENTDSRDRMKGIMKGLKDSGLKIILPLHPRTRKKIDETGLKIPANVYTIDPVGYLEMVWLEANCRAVATDSGGVQKEAYFHGKPCVTLRDETEWVELIEVGANCVVGADPELIANQLNASQYSEYTEGLYGNASSGSEIARIIQ